MWVAESPPVPPPESSFAAPFRSMETLSAQPPAITPGAKPAPIGPLVRRFFAELDRREIPWAVLRGSDGLPDETRYDIDLLIEPAATDRVEDVLRECARVEGWSIVRIVDKFRYRCCLAVSPGPEPRFLPIDLFGGCYHRFYPMADGGFGLSARRRNAAGVAVVPPGFGAAVALIKELTRHPTFKANSRDEVQAGANEDPDGFRRGVEDILGSPLTEELLAACQRGDWSGVEWLVPDLRRAVGRGSSRISLDALRFFAGNLRHHLWPPMSGLVVLLGPDGSGKSTIADRVAERLYKHPFKVVRRFEYQFRILPEMKRIKRRLAEVIGRRVAEKPVVEPGTRGSGMNRDHPPLVGMFYVTYYAFDFFIGRLLLRKLSGQGGLLVFARYFHDYYYQRGYGRVPRGYLRLLERLAPKPDLILHLDRDADDIFRGKPELDREEIERQQRVIRELVTGRENAAIIDASAGIEATVEVVCRRVHEVFLAQHGGKHEC